MCSFTETKHKNMKWISVQERLPNDRQSVLFCTEEGVYIGRYWEGSKSINGNMAGCYDEDILLANITHWMPLPQPPKHIILLVK